MSNIVEQTGKKSIEIDVDTTAPVAGDALVWDSTSGKWIPGGVTTTSTLLEWDRVSDYSSNMISINPSQVYDILSITIPTAGVYRLNFSVRTTSIGNWVSISLDNTAGTIDGITWISNIDPDGNQDQTSGSIIYQATASETITLRATNGSGGVVSFIGDSNGGHYLEYQKLSGFLPHTDYVQNQAAYYTVTGEVSNQGDRYPLNLDVGNMPVVNGNTVLLTAGVTYEMDADLVIRCTWAEYAFYDEATNNRISSVGVAASVNSVDTTNIVQAHGMITPTVDMYVSLRIGNSSGYNKMDLDRSTARIKAISGQLPITNNLAGGITDNTFSKVLTSPDGALQVRGTVNGQIDAKAASGSWSASQIYVHTTGGGGGSITLQNPVGDGANLTNWTTVGVGYWGSHGGVNTIHMHDAISHKMYRITMMIDRGYVSNPISIEILV